MKKPALNSTQKFIEIIDVYDNVAILANGNASQIIEVDATNFDLLSVDEQNAKIYAYSSLLNSLSFPIQIVIRSKQLDISSYIQSLDYQGKQTTNQALSNHISLYKKFVADLVKKNFVLDKKFYIVIPYSSLEKGLLGAKQSLNMDSVKSFEVGAKAALASKSEGLKTQLSRIGLKAKVLGREDILKLFYEIYNDNSIHQSHVANQKTAIVKGDENAGKK